MWDSRVWQGKILSGRPHNKDFQNQEFTWINACDEWLSYQENNSLQKNVNLLFESLGFKEEKVRDWKGGYIFTEILSTFWSFNTEEAINIIKSSDNTFELFKKVSDYTFKEIQEKNKKYWLNVLLKDLWDKNFITYIDSLEDKFQIDKSNCVFEIWESDYWELNFKVIHALVELKERWYEVAIDDLDLRQVKDNISLKILKRLTKIGYIPKYIKIDWKYFQSLFQSKDSQKIDELTNFICEYKRLGTICIVEWTETNEQCEFAEDLWADWYQSMFLDDNFYLPEKKNGLKFLIDNSKSFKLVDEVRQHHSVKSFSLTLDNEVESFKTYWCNRIAQVLELLAS